MTAKLSMPVTSASGITPQGTAWSSYGQGEPMVLIHGVGMNQSVWAPQIHALQSRFQVVVYDMLGHGQSSLPSGTKDLADYANQCVQLLDTLGLPKAHIVGHSMGALIALEMAIAHPERCISVAALNGVYRRTEEQRQLVSERAADIEANGKPSDVSGTIERWFGKPIPRADEGAAVLSTQLLQQVPQQGYARAYTVFANSDERHVGRMADIQVPTLLATGELDPNSSPDMSRAMHREIPHSRLEVLPRQRHMMSLIAVGAVNDMLSNFAQSASATNV